MNIRWTDERYEYFYIDKTEYREHPEGLILWGEPNKRQYGVAREKEG